jgi:hypothetical protein
MSKVRRKRGFKRGSPSLALFEGAKGLLALDQVMELYESGINGSAEKM